MPVTDAHYASAAERVLVRLEEAPGPLRTPCWLWQGARSGSGYGYVRVGGRAGIAEPVHVVVYRALVRRPGRGKVVHHRCETPLCANPGHLEELTRLQHARRHRSDVCPRCNRPRAAVYGKTRETRHRVCVYCRNVRRRARYRTSRAA